MCHCLLPPNAARLAAPTRSRWRVSWRPQNRRPNLSGGPLHFVTDPNQQTQVAHFESAPGGTRTHDPRLRRPMLYPAELLAQASISLGFTAIDPENLRAGDDLPYSGITNVVHALSEEQATPMSATS